jgi:hypothetical protein
LRFVQAGSMRHTPLCSLSQKWNAILTSLSYFDVTLFVLKLFTLQLQQIVLFLESNSCKLLPREFPGFSFLEGPKCTNVARVRE